MTDEVDYISGSTRLFAILGDPIAQVRSPEMVTAELRARGMDAILIPVHAPVADFEVVLRGLMATRNLEGMILTIPFKASVLPFLDHIGPQAQIVGAVNAMARLADGRWSGEIFDGLGCVTGIKASGHALVGKRVHLIGAGGAGSAIGIAVAFERPALIRVFDPDARRAADLCARIARVDPRITTEVAAADPQGADFILNASPVGMLGDTRSPVGTDDFPPGVVVFDAIVMPERTPLLTAARRAGCATVGGRAMMRGQISRIVDFFREPSLPNQEDRPKP